MGQCLLKEYNMYMAPIRPWLFWGMEQQSESQTAPTRSNNFNPISFYLYAVLNMCSMQYYVVQNEQHIDQILTTGYII